MTTPALQLGHGGPQFEIFIEPTCPFCVKTLRKLDALIDTLGDDHVTITLRILNQPWHIFSATVARCVLAAATLDNGHDAAFKVLHAVADQREAYVLKHHHSGPNRNLSPEAIITKIEADTGLALKTAFESDAVTTAIKWHAKYARQNGAHETPTFMINGLIQPQIGSGDSIEQWADALRAAS